MTIAPPEHTIDTTPSVLCVTTNKIKFYNNYVSSKTRDIYTIIGNKNIDDLRDITIFLDNIALVMGDIGNGMCKLAQHLDIISSILTKSDWVMSEIVNAQGQIRNANTVLDAANTAIDAADILI